MMILSRLSRIIIFFILTFRFSGAAKVGICDICMDSNYVACLDENHFSTCDNGELLPNITPCPANRVCTADRQICRLPEDGFTPICYEENCGNCQRDNTVFACLDQTTYGYCFGQSTPYSQAIRSCPEGYVCNVYSNDVCVPADTNKPSCLTINTTPSPPDEPSTEDTTTTSTNEISTPPMSSSTSAPENATTYCGKIGKNGYFKTNDPTCREYVYCYLLSGQYLGWYYYCDGYFNAETGKCQTERPSDCVEQ